MHGSQMMSPASKPSQPGMTRGDNREPNVCADHWAESFQMTIPPRDKDDHVNAKWVQPPTRAVSRFPVDESCAGDPRRARQVGPDDVKVSGKLSQRVAARAAAGKWRT